MLLIWRQILLKEFFVDIEKDEADFEGSKESTELCQAHYDIVWVPGVGEANAWELEVDLDGALDHDILLDAFIVSIEE